MRHDEVRVAFPGIRCRQFRFDVTNADQAQALGEKKARQFSTSLFGRAPVRVNVGDFKAAECNDLDQALPARRIYLNADGRDSAGIKQADETLAEIDAR